jgi:PmbA protein
VSYGGNFGFASTDDEKDLEKRIDAAKKNAKLKGRDEDWKGFVEAEEDKRRGKVEGIYDRDMVDLNGKEMIEFVESLMEGIKSVKGTFPVGGEVSTQEEQFKIINTNGIEEEEKRTMIYGSAEASFLNDGMNSAYDFAISRSLGIDFEEIGRNAANLAKNSSNGKKIRSGKYDLALSPLAASELFDNIFIHAINGEEVMKGRSKFSNLGEEVGDAGLTILDDGLFKGGCGTAPFDDEGFPSGKNYILDEGILKNFIYDSYTAGKEGKKSTGNAVRIDYSSFPEIDVRNLIVSHNNVGDPIKETRDGILINSFIGAHTSNKITGDFSLEGKNAFKVERGEIKYPIKSLMVYGNFFDLLKAIVIAGRDIKMVYNIVTPSILVEDQKVI